MKEELHLFILWKNALDKKEEILKDINNKFEVYNMYNVTWSDEKYSENLSRFYGTKLPNGCEKEKHCGKGTFLLIIVKDKNPKYDNRDTTAGSAKVNTNMFDSKMLYRELTGGGHKVHCTNSVSETNHDLTLLLGKNVEDYLKENKSQKEILEINQDLFGANGFSNAQEMFYVLNNCIDYAVLRNYETLPDEIYVNEHNDIDVICYSRENMAYILNATKAQELEYRVQYHVKVNDKIANFDLRYVGDKYYDENLEKDVLSRREFNEKGFYTLSKEDYFYTLLYHALIHKPNFAQDYKDKLSNMNSIFNVEISNNIEKSIKLLEDWLIKNQYIIEKPIDLSVYFNEEVLKQFSKLLYREDNQTKKKINELEIKNKELVDELNFIKNSRTWKLTSGIRKINAKLKKGGK